MSREKPRSEAWWSAVLETPDAFRDPASVASLLDGAVSPNPAARSRGRYALARVVKALEGGDPEHAGAVQRIADRLPELAEGLADPDDHVRGCTISILRRIPATAPTVERLLTVFDWVPPEARHNVIEALGGCEVDAWNDRVERLLHACAGDDLHNNAFHAVEKLGNRRTRLPETVDLLASLARDASPLQDVAIRSLCWLLYGSLGPLAARRIEEILASATEDVRRRITQQIGYVNAPLAAALLAPKP